MNMMKSYYKLTKPGILYGNALTMIAGFMVAAQGQINYSLLFATLIGLSCVIASACVCNNYIDRSIDEKMTRTKERALVTGEISVQSACLFAMLLGTIGMLTLMFCTNTITTAMAAAGFFVYVVLYSIILKCRSTYGTFVGSIAGAVPPVVGYLAIEGQLDKGALVLFLILVCWQMPHFFAIAMYRHNDYEAASIPVLPVKRGNSVTKIHTLLYILSFIATSSMLTVYGYTSYLYLAAVAICGLAWLWLCIQGFFSDDDTRWAKKMFLFSLVIITIWCITISVDIALLS